MTKPIITKKNNVNNGTVKTVTSKKVTKTSEEPILTVLKTSNKVVNKPVNTVITKDEMKNIVKNYAVEKNILTTDEIDEVLLDAYAVTLLDLIATKQLTNDGLNAYMASTLDRNIRLQSMVATPSTVVAVAEPKKSTTGYIVAIASLGVILGLCSMGTYKLYRNNLSLLAKTKPTIPTNTDKTPIDSTVDVDQTVVKIVMTKELLVSGVKADAAYLQEKGINRTAGLASFYYINNAKYFGKDLTEQLIKDGILPDSPAKALDEYNAVMSDIINKNIDVMYVTNASLSRAEKESKMISFDKFAINDIDKKVLVDLDKKSMDIADTTTIEDTTTKFRASYDLLLGVAKTADNDTINEMTQGGSYLAKMGPGIMTTVNGAYKGMTNAVVDPLQVYIQNARADMLVYIGETCGYNNACTTDTCTLTK